MMDISLLGTGGMMPLPGRYLTSLLVRYNGQMVLIDCGEGTQISMKLLGWGYKNISTICFTHYHADHIAGLPGLLLAISNSGRTEELTLIGPPDLARITQGLMVITPDLEFPVVIKELENKEYNEFSLNNTEMFLSALPLRHGKPCFAYSITTKRLGKFDLEKAVALNLPKQLWSKLHKGEDVLYEGQNYSPDMVAGPPRNGFKVSYCTDTRPFAGISGFVQDSDLFICEGLYGDPEKADLARSHMHMTYSEAAKLAKDGRVEYLWLTHYSPAMVNPKEHLSLARDIFPNTSAGYDRITKTLVFKN